MKVSKYSVDGWELLLAEDEEDNGVVLTLTMDDERGWRTASMFIPRDVFKAMLKDIDL